MITVTRSLRPTAFAAPLLVATSLLAAACGGGGDSGATGGTAGADLLVTGVEYKFDQPDYNVKPGVVKIGFENKGKL